MNLLISIFGGMLLTVVLYGIGRHLRLSNFWAAVAGAGLPSLGYLVYAPFAWPGVDVVTMHLMAYPTVGVLLFQLYGERAGKFTGVHWAPRLMVVFFVLLTVVMGGFVYIAGQGLPPALASLLLPGAAGKTLHTGFAGVVAHGDEAAKGIGHHRNMEVKLARLGWQVEVVGLDGVKAGRENEVRVLLRDRAGAAMPHARVRLELGRPGQAPERALALSWDGREAYRARAGVPAGGAWLATLILEAADERIVLERELDGRGQSH